MSGEVFLQLKVEGRMKFGLNLKADGKKIMLSIVYKSGHYKSWKNLFVKSFKDVRRKHQFLETKAGKFEPTS